jgi:hypothetical protein
MDSIDKHRLHDLTSRLCEGDIEPTELSALSSLLAEDEDAIREYLSYTSLHLALEHRLRDTAPADEPRESGTTSILAELAPIDAPASTSAAKAKLFRYAAAIGIAASLLVVAGFLLRVNSPPSDFSARIVQMVDCDWGEGSWSTAQSSLLEAGDEIRLERGVMTLEFGSGAEVVLEAPIQLRIIDRNRCALNVGKLLAYVPQRGYGFTVAIPHGEVKDLSTSFGVIVEVNGDSETHVFQGRVRVRGDFRAAGETVHEWELRANEAVKLAPSTKSITRLPANKASFVEFAAYQDASWKATEATVDIPQRRSLVLWLDAARRLQLDESNRVVSWGNLAVGVGDLTNNAWQVVRSRRPLWVAPAADRPPRVHFNGSTCLVTSPYSSTDDVTVVSVFRGMPAALTSNYGQLVDFNGPPTLSLELTRTNQLVGQVISRGQSRNAAGRLEGPLPDGDELVVAVYSYGAADDSAALYINGELVGKVDAPINHAVSSSKYIGSSHLLDSYFVGDLHEVMFFNSVLTVDEVMQVSAELMRKYSVNEPEPEPRVLSRLIPEHSEPIEPQDAQDDAATPK